jgi:hypothetical protein
VQPRMKLRQLIIVATASVFMSGLFLQSAIAETKVKPDLPLDEEIYEPPKSSAPKKSNKKSHAKQEHATPPAQQHTQEGAPAHHSSDAETHGQAPAGAEHRTSSEHETKSDHAPEQHAPKSDEHELSEEEYHEPSHATDNHNGSHKEPKLLEGKVEPTPAAKGSGMVWFVVIFILLAAAIFIFT